MSKLSQVGYICNNCGFETSRWLGQCPQCLEWNSFEENLNSITETLVKSSKLEVLEASKLKARH